MTKTQLGVIRISAAGAVFEAPYFDEHEFPRMVIAIRSHQGYEPEGTGVFIPYHSIDWMVKVSKDVLEAQREGAGETRQ